MREIAQVPRSAQSSCEALGRMMKRRNDTVLPKTIECGKKAQRSLTVKNMVDRAPVSEHVERCVQLGRAIVARVLGYTGKQLDYLARNAQRAIAVRLDPIRHLQPLADGFDQSIVAGLGGVMFIDNTDAEDLRDAGVAHRGGLRLGCVARVLVREMHRSSDVSAPTTSRILSTFFP